MTVCTSPASSAYYHPRRPRPLRIGDRVKLRPGVNVPVPGDRVNYPGAENYGTVTAVSTGPLPTVWVRADNLPASVEDLPFYPEEVSLL